MTGRPELEGMDDRDLWVVNVTDPADKGLLLDSSAEEAVIHGLWWSPDGTSLFTFNDVPGPYDQSGRWGGQGATHYDTRRLTLGTK